MTLPLVHAVLGVLLLVSGGLAAASRKRRDSRHRLYGTLYVGLLIITLTTGMWAGARSPGTSLFEVMTPPTLAMGMVGYTAARRKQPMFGKPWRYWHILGMGGSYIGVVTATAFQVIPRMVDVGAAGRATLWLLPTAVGVLMMNRAVHRWCPGDARRESPTGGGGTAQTYESAGAGGTRSIGRISGPPSGTGTSPSRAKPNRW